MQPNEYGPTEPRTPAANTPPPAPEGPGFARTLLLALLVVALGEGALLLQLTQQVAGLRDQIRATDKGLQAFADDRVRELRPAVEARVRLAEESAQRSTDDARARMEKALRESEARLEKRVPAMIDSYVEAKLRTLGQGARAARRN